MVITFIRKHLTWLIYLMVIVFGLSVFLMGLGPILNSLGLGGGGALNPNRVVAESLGRKFTMTEVDNMAQMEEQRAQQSGLSINPVMHLAYLSRAIDMLGDRALLMNTYEKERLEYDDKEAQKILDQVCTSVLGQVGAKAEGEGLLASANKRKACKQHFPEVAQGYSFEQYSQDVIEQLKIQAAAKFVSEREAKTEENRVRKDLLKIRNRLKGKGEKAFAEEAKKESEDTGSKESGGDLGEFGRGRMVKPFEEAAFKAKVGEMTEPVKSDFGFHLIYVYAKKEAKGPDFEAAVPALRLRLMTEKQAKAAANDKTASPSAKTKTPKVSMKEIREAYETVSARHILKKVASKDDLFQAWRNLEISRAVPDIRDPLLNAFRYERKLPPHTKSDPDPTERIRLYQKAVDQEPREAVRHYLLCKSLEARYDADVNRAEQDAAKATQEKQKTMSGSVDPVKPKTVDDKDIKAALKCINKTITLTETPPEVVQGQPAFPPQTQTGQYYLLRAQLNDKLKKGSKAVLKDAEQALAFANGDVSTLYAVKTLFEKHGASARAQETQVTITNLMEAMQKASEAAQGGAAPQPQEKKEEAKPGRGSY